MVTFPLSFVASLFKGPFPINAEVLSFPCTALILYSPFLLGALWDAEDRIVLDYISRSFGLSLYILGNVSLRLGPWALM